MCPFSSLCTNVSFTFFVLLRMSHIYKNNSILKCSPPFLLSLVPTQMSEKNQFLYFKFNKNSCYICPRAFSEPNVNSVSWFGRLREQPLPKSQTLLQFNTSNVTRLEHVLRKLVNYLEKSEIINHPAIPN